MEGLRKLEEVQRTILLMQSEGFMSCSNNSSNDPDSDRFLSNFILLLIQPCGGLDVEKKCQLIYANLPKISAVFAEEAMPCLNEEGNCENKSDFGALQTDYEDMAMVGLGAMQDANSTLEDFCRSYFMFHDMDVNKPQSIFRYLPMLSFTESYIYQLDRLNEKLVKLPTEGVKGLEQGFHGANQSRVIKFIELFKTNPLKPLILLLEHHGLFTERIREEFRCGEEYWRLERKLCGALTSNKKIEVEDVMRAVHLKSFDYRVLNLLLYQLRSVKVDEVHMEFLSVSEFLVELSDDLFDYEDDVLENNFNVLRMFVRIHGASEAPTMLAKCISDAEKKYDRLLKALDPNLSSNYQERCEEATKEGGKTSGPSLGTWSIPPVIEDEDFYRSKTLNSN
ncbi:uncharacterized protein LOC131298228 isoform X2 [Rhododendron vialii]|uniref:uncharacterized protein LOC131298228 isoform X2 n=1 Tax=Rhododendron vialii TaxID=182163 RepID=UPI00265E809F|nr:uncharacterized protein LOC131298228 isoform X2 [Rhododendron vialii]